MAKKGMNIYKRKDGRWEGRYKNGYKPDGKPKYSSVYEKSYSAVRRLLEAKKAETAQGVSSCKASVCEILTLWLADIRVRIKESTFANYEMKLEKHILPYFSGMRYDKLDVQAVNNFIRKKTESGLSAKYVSDIAAILKSAAKFASRNFGCANRIEYVTLPKSHKTADKPMLNDAEQNKLRSFLINSGSVRCAGILLASVTGIRIGELCALKWSDIDFEKSILTVSRTVQRIKNSGAGGATKIVVSSPKSEKSNREIPLPHFIIPILKKYKSEGSAYIISESSRPAEPRTMQYRFKSLLKKAGIPQVNFHALRHMFATKCVELGFDIKTLSEILGHSSVEVTLSRYVHSSMAHKRSCMKIFSDNILSA